ncbi:MAG: hypothetical protein HQM12_04720 [SAR324 cluster bacterium]|nr:hypothetical protein [SAR324 cluster bacterium]
MKNFKHIFLLLILFLMLQESRLFAESDGHTAIPEHPLLFLGNHALPPMIYEIDSQMHGIVVDIAEELRKRIKKAWI